LFGCITVITNRWWGVGELADIIEVIFEGDVDIQAVVAYSGTLKESLGWLP
jgi:hypothetical protein